MITSNMVTKARLLAFYLPQFQPTPENDAWWGKGFTEWTNVAKAKPLYRGHKQPRVPADLGFYDLRLSEVREEQAEMARSHSIEGFCYWHYWFEGRRILDRVEKEVLRSGTPEFPFCLAWANHNWSRSWLGDTNQILLEQTYSDDDTVRHAQYLAEFFADPRYIRVMGRPLYSVYAPFELPNAPGRLDLFRNEIVRLGLPNPLILATNARSGQQDACTLGFDSNLEMWPKWSLIDNLGTGPTLKDRWANGSRYGVWRGNLKIYDYEETLSRMVDYTFPHPHYKSLCIGWDNSARRGKSGWMFDDPKPEVFGQLLSKTIDSIIHLPRDERVIFLNAWNEWGEGMYLEPDLEFGRAFLDEVHRVNGVGASSTVSAPVG